MKSFTWTAQQRRDTIRAMRSQLDRLEHDHHLLAALTHDHRPDGYPTGHGGRGARGTYTDPTGHSATIRADAKDFTSEAAKALTLLWKASHDLEQADSSRALALPPVAVDPSVDDAWCVSCLRIGTCTPRTPRRGGRQDLCTWCQHHWYAEGALPSLGDLDLHARGIPIRVRVTSSSRIVERQSA